MNNSQAVKFCLLLILTWSTLLGADLQYTLSWGGSRFLAAPDKYLGNAFTLELTPMPTSRLQFGLKLDETSSVADRRTFYNCRGILFTTRLLLNQFTPKTPYFGFNLGWVDSDLAAQRIIYSTRTSPVGEALFGYSFRLSEDSRFNLEYRQRYVELKLPDQELLRSEVIAAAFSFVWRPAVGESSAQGEQIKMTKAEGLAQKKISIQERLALNQRKIAEYDQLLHKYDEKIKASPEPQANDLVEREQLLKQKQDLEQENKNLSEQSAL